ncbi:MAG: hypothetical protein Q8M01_15500 [Rubrivivax sp.]|nr:hypothetical protein [Rubrivivax sp.]
MELKHRLTLLARDRLANLPGALERFEVDLAGPRLLAEAGALPEVYRQAELTGNTKATAAIQAHLTAVVDRWAKAQALAVAVQPLASVGAPSTCPETAAKRAQLSQQAACASPSHAEASQEEAGIPITTEQLCDGFDGLKWTSLQWRTTINKRVPDWLVACKATKGTGGASPKQATWWPIKVARALAAKRPRGPATPVQEIDRAFRTRPTLKTWTKAWVSYREDHPELG